MKPDQSHDGIQDKNIDYKFYTNAKYYTRNSENKLKGTNK